MSGSKNNRWPIIQDILTREGVAKQHLNSFDEFLKKGLQEIINEIGHIDIENAEYPYKIELGRIRIQQPRMMELDGSITHVTPAEARLRNVSYVAPLMMEASVIEDGKTLESRFLHVGDIPVMVKSDGCILRNFTNQKLIDHAEDPEDPGGYFIINGSERVIVGLEDLSYNKIIVDADKIGGKKVFKAKVYSSIVGYRAKLEFVLKEDGLIVARIPGSPVDIPIIILVIPVVLVLSQPDLGTSILIALSGLIVIWLSGVNIKYFTYSTLVLIISMPFVISFLKPYQKLRILTFFDPDRDPLGAGYQIIQSKIAVGSGGLSGKGFLKGTQSYLEFLPEKHTDFIFTLFSEEFGFLGSLLLLLIYSIMIYRIIRVGTLTRSFFSKLYCYGFGSAIFVYVVVNMCMVLGLLPIVGSPLPIMSYGGSSMLATMIGISIVMSAKIYHRQLIP